VRASGGVRVFVDQAVEDGFSADPLDIEVGHGSPGSVASGVGDALGDAPLPLSFRRYKAGSLVFSGDGYGPVAG
jgi:hypothetical protein